MEESNPVLPETIVPVEPPVDVTATPQSPEEPKPMEPMPVPAQEQEPQSPPAEG